MVPERERAHRFGVVSNSNPEEVLRGRGILACTLARCPLQFGPPEERRISSVFGACRLPAALAG